MSAALDPPQPIPLTYAQEPIWFLDQLEPGNTAYFIQTVQRLSGDLNATALEAALNEVLRRHESFRTTFKTVRGKPTQVISPPSILRLSIEQIPGATVADREAALKRRLDELAREPFDLRSGPLFRARLLQLEPREFVLGLFTHHIIVDGASLSVLWSELNEFYRAHATGTNAALPPPKSQPRHIAEREQRYWVGDVVQTKLKFWREQLAEPRSILDLPVDRSRSAAVSSRGAHCLFQIPFALFQEFKALCQQERATTFIGLLALYQLLLHRYSRQEDISVGYASSGRHREELEGAIGMFTNTTVFRTELTGSPTFLGLLRRVRSVALGVFEQQDFPFELLVQELAPHRQASQVPFFQAAFTYRVGDTDQAQFSGIHAQPLDPCPTGAKFELLLGMQETADCLWASFEYRVDLFDELTIRRMGNVLVELMRGVVRAPQRRVGEFALVSEDECREILKCAGDVPTDVSLRTVVDHFWEQARLRPGEPAVISEGRRVSYGELRARVEALADQLCRLGLESEQLVGVYLDRSADLVVAILGIWAAGGAYLPIDPGSPVERVRFMLEETNAQIVIAEGDLPHEMLPTSVRALSLRTANLEGGGGSRTSFPSLSQLAYVIYTSGSTGRPKGVMIEHRQLASYIVAIVERLELPRCGRYAMISTVAADLGHTVLFPALTLGGCIHLLSSEIAGNGAALAKYQAQHQLDVLKIVPSHLAALQSTEHPSAILPRQLLVLGGDVSRGDWARRLMHSQPRMRLANHYGPTETTVGAIAWDVCAEQITTASGTLPLGKPLKNSLVYILDTNLEVVPIGVPGEICIGGSGVGRGYWKRPDLTAERFINDRFRGAGKLYRTGDLGRFLSNGMVEFLGRMDQQVKVRGHRVELGEIETVLKQQEGISDAVVALKGPESELVAYVVPSDPRAAAICAGPTWKLDEGFRVAHLNRNETEYLYQEIFERQAYLRHGIRIRDGATILDVGANIGLFSIFANLVAHEPQIFAFEPNPTVYDALVRNMRAYGPRTRAINCGMSRTTHQADMTFYEGFSLLSGFYTNEQAERQVVKNFILNQQRQETPKPIDQPGTERQIEELLAGRFKSKTVTARLTTISSFLAEARIETVDLLKVNVEKSERDVLEGINGPDWRKIRQVVLEVDVKANLQPIVNRLEEQGYEVVVEQDRMLAQTELCYVYAIRPGEHGRLVPATSNGQHRLAVRKVEVKWPAAEELRKAAARRLPDPMVPRRYVYLESLPLTNNGKIDRSRLPEVAPLQTVTEVVAPRNEHERIIQEIWGEILGIKEVGMHANFFELGGHSLKATQVVSRVSEVFQIELPLRTFFESPTVAGLGEAVERMLLAEIAQLDDADAAELARQ